MTADAEPELERERERARRLERKRLAEIFGDVLPDSTRDDQDEPGQDGTRDTDLIRDVPPHHG